MATVVQLDQPGVLFELHLLPAAAEHLNDVGVALALRASLGSAASVAPQLVFFASVVDRAGHIKRFADSDPVNVAGAAGVSTEHLLNGLEGVNNDDYGGGSGGGAAAGALAHPRAPLGRAPLKSRSCPAPQRTHPSMEFP